MTGHPDAQQILDGIDAGLIGIATPLAAERILSGRGRFNLGLAAVMTVQGVGPRPQMSLQVG